MEFPGVSLGATCCSLLGSIVALGVLVVCRESDAEQLLVPLNDLPIGSC